MVAPSREQVGFPDLSTIGAAFGIHNPLSVTDYVNGIPLADLSKTYEVRMPAIDADGNETIGVRVPELAAPLATYTGWNLRKTGFAPGEACALAGSTLSFAQTAATRQPGDPRPALMERYSGKADYVNKVQAAAQALVGKGFLLQDDVSGYVNQVQAVTVFP